MKTDRDLSNDAIDRELADHADLDLSDPAARIVLRNRLSGAIHLREYSHAECPVCGGAIMATDENVNERHSPECSRIRDLARRVAYLEKHFGNESEAG